MIRRRPLAAMVVGRNEHAVDVEVKKLLLVAPTVAGHDASDEVLVRRSRLSNYWRIGPSLPGRADVKGVVVCLTERRAMYDTKALEGKGWLGRLSRTRGWSPGVTTAWVPNFDPHLPGPLIRTGPNVRVVVGTPP